MAFRSSQKISSADILGDARRWYEFGLFRLDPQRRLLLRENDPVSLIPKALEMLIVLIENRNRVVSKDELMTTLWPDSVVEESNLSQNIFLLRKALGDSAQERRYILTIPGRGYQFIETVREASRREEAQKVALPMSPSPGLLTREDVSGGRRIWIGPALLLLIALICASVAWRLTRRAEGLRLLEQRRLTANSPDQPVTHAAISPDGKYLGYGDRRGLHLELLDTGQSRTVQWPIATQAEQAFWEFESWYPDSTRFTARLAAPGKPISLWSVPLLEGTPLELSRDAYGGSRVSPNGSAIAYLSVPVFLENNIGDPYTLGAREIWLMGPNGESPHRILTAGDLSGFERIAWSPAGDRIAYKYWHQHGETTSVSIESRDLNGSNPVTIFSDNRLDDFTWISSQRLILSRNAEGASSDFSADNLWELRLDSKSGTPQAAPHRLTDWSGFSITDLNHAASGKRFTFLRSARHHSVLVGDLADNGTRLVNARQVTTDDHSNIPFAWTHDSRKVIFLSRRSQIVQIYAQALDGSPPRLVSSAPAIDFETARLAPNGVHLIALGKMQDSTTRAFYRIPIEGGIPQLLFVPKGENCGDFRCTNEQTNFCAYQIQMPGHRQLMIQSFDPVSGKENELLRIPVDPGTDYHWALSPDGLKIGILKSEWGSNQIRFFDVRSGADRRIAVTGYAELRSLDWGRDSRSVFVGSSGPGGSTLLHIDLNGRAQAIWQQPQPLNTWGVPSPDGRHLAIFGTSMDANVWMVDNF